MFASQQSSFNMIEPQFKWTLSNNGANTKKC